MVDNNISREGESAPGIECDYCDKNFSISSNKINGETLGSIAVTALVRRSLISRLDDFVEEMEGRKKLIRLILSFLVFLLPLFFNLSSPVDLSLYLFAYVIIGVDIIVKAISNLFRAKLFDEFFLMTIATVGAFAIGSYAEGVAVMLFFQLGDYLEDRAIENSKRTITSLLNIRPEYANVVRDGKYRRVPPEEVEVGEIVIVKPGEKIPLDGTVVKGSAYVDESSITGESVPKSVGIGCEVFGGTVSTDGLLQIRVLKPYKNSTVYRILELVREASTRKSTIERFVERFARYYTPFVVLFALLLAFLPPLIFVLLLEREPMISDWIYRSLIFLVVSCPCALVVSIPLGFFAGIGKSARRGILVKGSNFLDALNSVDTVVFDKTGTLTEGKFRVVRIYPQDGFSEEEVLYFAYVGERFSNHPIARAIVSEYKELKQGLTDEEGFDFREFPGMGIVIRMGEKRIVVGNELLLKKEGIYFSSEGIPDAKGIVHVTVDGVYAGSIVVEDRIRREAKEAISSFKSFEIKRVFMLTGDRQDEAYRIGNRVGVDRVFSELLPEDKMRLVESFKHDNKYRGKVLVIGDGINDAPMLANADIGVAMGGIGSDVAVESGNIVLMNDNLLSLVDGFYIARKTRKIVVQNILFALGVKLIFLILGALGFATLWEAVFADVGVTLIAILNTLRIFRGNSSQKPHKK